MGRIFSIDLEYMPALWVFLLQQIIRKQVLASNHRRPHLHSSTQPRAFNEKLPKVEALAP